MLNKEYNIFCLKKRMKEVQRKLNGFRADLLLKKLFYSFQRLPAAAEASPKDRFAAFAVQSIAPIAVPAKYLIFGEGTLFPIRF